MFQNPECAEKGIRFLMAQWAIKNLIQVEEKRFVIFDRWKWLLYIGLFLFACLSASICAFDLLCVTIYTPAKTKTPDRAFSYPKTSMPIATASNDATTG